MTRLISRSMLTLVLGFTLGLAFAQDRSLSVFDFVRVNEGFETLTQALEQTGLADTLAEEGPYTLLAPTDEAFASLPSTRRNELFSDADAMRALLERLIVPGRLSAADLVTRGSVVSVAGEDATFVAPGDGSVRFGDLTIAQTDLGLGDGLAIRNGVVHVIESLPAR